MLSLNTIEDLVKLLTSDRISFKGNEVPRLIEILKDLEAERPAPLPTLAAAEQKP